MLGHAVRRPMNEATPKMKAVLLFSILAFVKTEKESSFENSPRKEIPEEQKFIDAERFNERYVSRNAPVVMKAAVNDLISQKFGEESTKPYSYTTYLDVKNGQDGSVRMMSIHQFLSHYEHENISVDAPIPTVIKSQMNIPKSLLCQPTIQGMKRTSFESRSGNWREALKADPGHSMSCVLSGNSHYILFNASGVSNQDKNVILNFVEQAIGNGSSDSYATFLDPGDCLFVPSRWFQQRITSGKHISFSLYWTPDSTSNQTECIRESTQDLLNLPFPDDPPMDILSLIEFNELHHFISEYYLNTDPMDLERFLKKLPSDKNLDGIPEFDSECRDIALEMFGQMDFNGDGRLSEGDFQTISKEELRDLSGRLDDRLADLEDIREDARAEKKGRSLVTEAAGDTDDLRRLIQEGFGELFSEIEAAKGAQKIAGEAAEIKRIENVIKDSIPPESKRDEL